MRPNKPGRYLKVLGLLLFSMFLSACQGVAVLDPKGPVGLQERDLIVMSVVLALVIIIPVLVMVVLFAVRYRETNTKATYKPHWEGNVTVEVFIWAIPILIIGILSYLTVVKTIDLDPYKPIASTERPLHVQVVSLDWNWLFLYPDQNVASMNKLVIPAGVPVTFDLTSATVMTSFFIPDLGSQIYAMAGMVTHLNLMSDHPGTFTGRNLEFSGLCYSTMHFSTEAVSKDQFDAWTKSARDKGNPLSLDLFNKMNTPQSGLPPDTFATVEPNLFGHIVGEFMKPVAQAEGSQATMDMSDGKM